MSNTWRTAWQGQDIVVFRDETEVDRVSAPDIERVVFVYSGSGARDWGTQKTQPRAAQ